MYEIFQLGESVFAEQLEKRARLAAGNYQAVEIVELPVLFDQHNFRAEFLQTVAVRVEIALQC
jgi:hypothetical protein